MVRAKPDDDGSNAFAIDENDDMDALLEAAANSGSAVADELDDDPFTSDLLPDSYVSSGKLAPDIDFGISEQAHQDARRAARIAAYVPPIDRVDGAPAYAAPSPEPKDNAGVGDEIDALLETLDLHREVSTDNEPAVTHAPEPIRSPTVFVEQDVAPVLSQPVYVAPIITPEPIAKLAPTPAPVTVSETPKSMPKTDQVELAKRIIATVDAYRSLTKESKDVVAQLLAPTSAEFSQDEGIIAIRAIYAESIQESTQKALIEAKNSSPVDRVFYILGLPNNVLHYLGELVQAYSGVEMPVNAGELQFAKVVVDAIEGLGDEPIIYAEAMAKVLSAAQG